MRADVLIWKFVSSFYVCNGRQFCIPKSRTAQTCKTLAKTANRPYKFSAWIARQPFLFARPFFFLQDNLSFESWGHVSGFALLQARGEQAKEQTGGQQFFDCFPSQRKFICSWFSADIFLGCKSTCASGQFFTPFFYDRTTKASRSLPHLLTTLRQHAGFFCVECFPLLIIFGQWLTADT